MKFPITVFTVKVTFESFIRLLQQILSQIEGNKHGIVLSLEAKIMSAAASKNQGNVNVRNNILDAFQNDVSAQSGKALTAQQSEVLNILA